MPVLSSITDRVVVGCSRIDALIKKKAVHHLEMSVLGSVTDRPVVVCSRINAVVKKEAIQHLETSVLSSPLKECLTCLYVEIVR